MRRQQNIPHGLLYSLGPSQFAQLHIGDDLAGDEFDWDESVSQYEGESLANEMLGFLKEYGDE